MTGKEQILIQKYIDGELSPQEKIVVDGLIKNNIDVKKYYDDLNSIESMLKEDAQDKVSIDLKDQIMNEILGNEQLKDHPVKVENVLNRIFPNPRWNVAYAFVLGIMIGALIFTLAPKQVNIEDIPESNFAGSMSNSSTGSAFILPVDLPGIHLNINADKLQENYYKILVEVMTEEPGMVNLSFNKSGFYLQSIKMLKENSECRIISNRSSVQMFNSGENKFIILMKKLSYLPEDINIQVFLDEMIKYENVVTIN